jgi:hypothetical protein
LTGYAGLIFNSLLAGNISSALDNLNKAVNCSHNGGWGFNKFVSDSTLNEAAVSPAVMLLKCAPQLYRAILDEENNPKLSAWFAKRKTYDMSELDGVKTTKRVERCDCCGECNCDSCNPDHDCGNSDCDYCNPQEEKEESNPSGPIVTAQVKIVEKEGTLTAHIQYKLKRMPSNQSHLTKDITIADSEINSLNSVILGKLQAEYKSFSANSDTKYYKLMPSPGGTNYWVLGPIGLRGFYFKLKSS